MLPSYFCPPVSGQEPTGSSRFWAPKITAVVHLQSCTESGVLLLTLLRAGMERFLPSVSGSSAARLETCGEPTCKLKSQLVTSVHQCRCGRSMHGFCGRGIGKEGHGRQRESAQMAGRRQLETRPAAALCLTEEGVSYLLKPQCGYFSDVDSVD